MSRIERKREILEHIREVANSFDAEKIRVRPSEIHRVYFVEGEEAEVARRLGSVFWLPAERAYTIFLYGYVALFGIPEFTSEAVRRQPNRFSRRQLPHTIRTTAGFILDAFGYDRRLERIRPELYRPSPVIRNIHGKRGNKARISNAAMAYFGYNLICAAEQLSPQQDHPDFAVWQQEHYAYFGSFLRYAGYPFPHDRAEAAAFARMVDMELADNDYAEFWHNGLYTAKPLSIPAPCKKFRTFLLPESSRLFTASTASVCREMN